MTFVRYLASAIAGLALVSTSMADDVTGQASVIDGDTIEIHGTRIRLWGIDAPESSQLCRGEDSLSYRCGAEAANALDVFVARRPVECRPIDMDQYGRTVAACGVGGVDLGQWLVSRGLALDWPHYSHGKYAADQDQAEKAARGMWRGSFVEPWLYRRCVKSGQRPAWCSDEAR
jgi:endonuclease YncB( thermonuclease family)